MQDFDRGTLLLYSVTYCTVMPNGLQGNEFRAVKVTFILNLSWITHIEVVINPQCPHKHLVLGESLKGAPFNSGFSKELYGKKRPGKALETISMRVKFNDIQK